MPKSYRSIKWKMVSIHFFHECKLFQNKRRIGFQSNCMLTDKSKINTKEIYKACSKLLIITHCMSRNTLGKYLAGTNSIWFGMHGASVCTHQYSIMSLCSCSLNWNFQLISYSMHKHKYFIYTKTAIVSKFLLHCMQPSVLNCYDFE